MMNLTMMTIYSKLDNKNYVFEGKTTLKDFYRIINISGEF